MRPPNFIQPERWDLTIRRSERETTPWEGTPASLESRNGGSAMKPMNLKRAYFLQGSHCRNCHSRKFLRANRLCTRCARYSDKDYGALEEVLVSGPLLENRDRHQEHFRMKRLMQCVSAERNLLFPLMLELKLSSCQHDIMHLHFSNGRSLKRISEIREISLSSVKTHLARIRKKLRFCHPNFQWVNIELANYRSDSKIKRRKTLNTPPPSYLPSTCPRCGSPTWGNDLHFRYCPDCLWVTPG